MALPDISLAQFNRIASGEYNAGLVDLKTDDHGQLTGELAKVNNHVHRTSKNTVVLSPERVLEVKEAFLNALSKGGVRPDKLAEIRDNLGLPEDISASLDMDARHAMMERRFTPLTRQQVRNILDKYANQGRGFTLESQMAVSLADAEAAAATRNMSKSDVKTRKAVNIAALSAAKGRYAFEMCDALAVLSTDRSFAKICQIVGNRYQGENAVNEREAATTAVKNQFMALFPQALKLLDANETPEFTYFGMKAKLTKGADGKVTAVLGEGTMQQKVALGKTALGFLQDLMGRAVVDVDTLGADNVKLLMGKVFSRDVEGFLTGEDRTSLTRQFATTVLMKKTNSPEKMEVEYLGIMNGDYNTGTLVDIANLALEGKVATKADLDRLHAELAKNNAGLDDEMKEMLTRVAGMPIEGPARKGDGEMVVQKPIVADLGQVADAVIPKAPPVFATIPRAELHQTAETVKDFIADFVFSDETMLSDVVVDLPGAATRKMLASDDKKLAALSQIVKTPEILNAAVSPVVLDAVKDGFATMRGILDTAWRASHDGETLDDAAKKPDFLQNFSRFFRDEAALPGRELAKFDSIVQNMANKGCEGLQKFINKVFDINADAVRNAQGGFTTEPYKGMKPEQIKAALDAKNLNQILDDAATDSASPGQIALFKQVLSDYFVNIAKASDKRSVFASALRYAQTFDFVGKEGDALEGAKKVAMAKFTGAVLKGTSPLLQKMMQGLPRTVLGEYAEALDDMKSRLAPIPRKIVQAHLMKMVDDSDGKIKSIALKQSLGAASVGEAFLCEFTYVEDGVEKKEEMVVKIMRHDAEDRVKREAEVFTAAAAKIGPGMLKTWQGQLAQYMTEFDFRNEANNVNVGAGLYDVKGTANHPYKAILPDVASMKVSPLVKPSKNAMVCTLAPGETADSAFKEMREMIQTSLNPVFERDAETGRLKWDPQTRKPIFKQNVGAGMIHDARIFCAHEYSRIYATQQKLQQAASLWFSEALLGSGKFHGDAHAGNLMVTLGPEGQATFIDFGNLYELKTHYELDGEGNPVMETVQEKNEDGEIVEVQRPKVLLDERVELLRLILGATLRDKTFFMQGFEKLLSEDGKKAFAANRENVAAILDSVLAKGTFSFDVCYRLQGALTELQKLGLELPPQINCFVQSMTRFQNTIAEMNTILRQTGTVIDMLKEGPAPDKIPPADPADPLGEVLALSTTPEGKAMVELENDLYDPGAAPDDPDSVKSWTVPAYVAKMVEYGSPDGPLMDKDGEYQSRLRATIANAPDKPAEVSRIVELAVRHFDPVNLEGLIGQMRGMATTFATNWNAAPDDKAKAELIDSFVTLMARTMRQQINGYANSAKDLYTGTYEQPATFAKVVMGTLFNGAAAVQKMFDKNFSATDKAKMLLDATGVATGELNVSKADLAKTLLPSWMYSGPSADEIVLNAIVEDTKNMGDKKKSYQIDIGI